MAAFAQDLGSNLDRVTVVLMTEFGRTFARTVASASTTAAPAPCSSGRWRPGRSLRGLAGLKAQNIDGDPLRVTVDYRSVLADILEHRLATGNMAAVLPGYVDTPEKRLNLALPLG